MGEIDNLIVLKLGGSLITFKDRPLAASLANIRSAARAVASALPFLKKTRFFLLHGGGSFGHYYAKKYGLSTMLKQTRPEQVAVTSAAMMELHSIVLKEMLRAGVPCVSVLASQIFGVASSVLTANGKAYLRTLSDSGLIPITFGNVVVSKEGSLIVSGDNLALAMVKSFAGHKSRVVFGMDVDGIFQDEKLKGHPIDMLLEEHDISSKSRKLDVTGGVRAKVVAGFQLSRLGADVYFVNGSKHDRIVDALKGKDTVLGTKIYSHRKSLSELQIKPSYKNGISESS